MGTRTDIVLMVVASVLVGSVALGFALLYGGMAGRRSLGRTLRVVLTGVAATALVFMAGGIGLVVGAPLIAHLVGRPGMSVVALFAGQAPADAQFLAMARAGFDAALGILAIAILGSAVADRVRVRFWFVFAAAWTVLVFAPVAYSVFQQTDGWAVANLGAIDFGGAVPVSLAAGSGALGVLVASGRRARHGTPSVRHLPAIGVGSALVVVGWFGLAAGSERALDAFTPLILLNTLAAVVGSTLTWVVVDTIMMRRPTLVSVALGAACGLVGIAPTSGVITTGWSLLLGVLSALACAVIVDVASRGGFGVAMNVIVVHTIASVVGLLFSGLFADQSGMVYSGNFTLLGAQALTGVIAGAWSFGVSALLTIILRRFAWLRASAPDPLEGHGTSVLTPDRGLSGNTSKPRR